MKKKKIGIMGGTFNPIHNGHLILAENAYEQFNLNCIYFMPSKHPPHKDNKLIVSDDVRVDMIKLAINDNPHFKISTLELERKGITYTVDTLKKLKSMYSNNEYYFIMGADSLFQLEKWKNTEEILKLCHIVVATRKNLKKVDLTCKIDSLNQNYGSDIRMLQTPNFDISSKMIRERLMQRRTVKYFLPKKVELYILENKIYF